MCKASEKILEEVEKRLNAAMQSHVGVLHDVQDRLAKIEKGHKRDHQTMRKHLKVISEGIHKIAEKL